MSGRHVADALEGLGLFLANRLDEARPVAVRALARLAWTTARTSLELLAVASRINGMAARINPPAVAGCVVSSAPTIDDSRVNCSLKGSA